MRRRLSHILSWCLCVGVIGCQSDTVLDTDDPWGLEEEQAEVVSPEPGPMPGESIEEQLLDTSWRMRNVSAAVCADDEVEWHFEQPGVVRREVISLSYGEGGDDGCEEVRERSEGTFELDSGRVTLRFPDEPEQSWSPMRVDGLPRQTREGTFEPVSVPLLALHTLGRVASSDVDFHGDFAWNSLSGRSHREETSMLFPQGEELGVCRVTMSVRSVISETNGEVDDDIEGWQMSCVVEETGVEDWRVVRVHPDEVQWEAPDGATAAERRHAEMSRPNRILGFYRASARNVIVPEYRGDISVGAGWMTRVE